MAAQNDPVIHLSVPPRIHAKLANIAGFMSVDNWARDVLIRAAEEASPELTRSGMWRMDVSRWYDASYAEDDAT